MPSQESKIKKILGSKVTLFFLLLGLIWLVVNVVGVYYKKYKINKEILDLQAQISQTEKSNQQISAMIEYLSSQSFLEKSAREKLNMKKPGEEVVVVEVPKDLATTAPEIMTQAEPLMGGGFIQQEEKPKEDSNIIKWWKYFFR